MGHWIVWAAGVLAVAAVAVAAWVVPLDGSTTPNNDPPHAGSITASPGTVFTVENAAGEEVQITFVAVIEDSRCPKNVMCVWAGQAVIALSVEGGPLTAPRQVTLTLHAAPEGESVDIAGMRIQVTDVQPYPEDPNTTQPGDYTATLEFAAIEG